MRELMARHTFKRRTNQELSVADLGTVLLATREQMTDHPELDDVDQVHVSAFLGSLIQRYETLAADLDTFGGELPAGMDTLHAGRFFKENSTEYMSEFGGDRSQYFMASLFGGELDPLQQQQIVASYALTYVRDAYGFATAALNTPQAA